MSIHALDQVAQHSQATGLDRLVAFAIANFANDHGYAEPSVMTLARWARVSERRVQYAIRRLSKSGELVYLPGKGSFPTIGGRQKTHLYHLLVGDLQGGAQTAPPSKGVHGRSEGGAPGNPFRAKGVHRRAPELSTRTQTVEPNTSEALFTFSSKIPERPKTTARYMEDLKNHGRILP